MSYVMTNLGTTPLPAPATKPSYFWYAVFGGLGLTGLYLYWRHSERAKMTPAEREAERKDRARQREDAFGPPWLMPLLAMAAPRQENPRRRNARDAADGLVWCNCENSRCFHSPDRCRAKAGRKRAMYVGAICDGCARGMPREYMLPDKTANRRRNIKRRNVGKPSSVEFIADLASAHEEVKFTNATGRFATLYRFSRPLVTFRPTESQIRKIIKGKGRIRITERAVRAAGILGQYYP